MSPAGFLKVLRDQWSSICTAFNKLHDKAITEIKATGEYTTTIKVSTDENEVTLDGGTPEPDDLSVEVHEKKLQLKGADTAKKNELFTIVTFDRFGFEPMKLTFPSHYGFTDYDSTYA